MPSSRIQLLTIVFLLLKTVSVFAQTNQAATQSHNTSIEPEILHLLGRAITTKNSNEAIALHCMEYTGTTCAKASFVIFTDHTATLVGQTLDIPQGENTKKALMKRKDGIVAINNGETEKPFRVGTLALNKSIMVTSDQNGWNWSVSPKIISDSNFSDLKNTISREFKFARDVNGGINIFTRDMSNPGLGEAWKDPSGMIWGDKMSIQYGGLNEHKEAKEICKLAGAKLPSKADFIRLNNYMGSVHGSNSEPGYRAQALPNLADEYFLSSRRPHEYYSPFDSDKKYGDVPLGTLRECEFYSVRCVTR